MSEILNDFQGKRVADIVASSTAPAERSGDGGDLALPHFREEKTTFIFFSRKYAILERFASS